MDEGEGILGEHNLLTHLPKLGTESLGTDFHETPAQGGILRYVLNKNT